MSDDLTTRVDAFLDRVAAIRWMQPDAAMDACDPDAIQWCADRVEEHLAALGYTDEELPSPLVTVERDLITADDRWAQAWTQAIDARRDRPGKDAARRYFDRARDTLAVPMSDAAVDEVSRFVDITLRWVTTRSAEIAHTGLVLQRRFLGFVHAERALVDLCDERPHRAWSPLLGLWERGAFPLPMPDASVLLFVPRPGVRLAPPMPQPYKARRAALSDEIRGGFPYDWVMADRGPIARGRIAMVSPEPPRPRPQPRRPRRGEGD